MSGAGVPEAVRQRVRVAASERCGYCLSPQRLVIDQLEIEHLLSRARGGGDEESNLWLSCSLCNSYKGTQVEAADPLTEEVVPLYNPRADNWSKHFNWSADGVKIVGLTP